MRFLIKAFLVGALLLPLASLNAAPDLRLAVVDVNEVINNIEEGKLAKDNLEKEKVEKEKALEGKKSEFQKLKTDYDKQKLILSQEALMEKQKELQVLAADIQNALFAANDELNKKYNDTLMNLYRKVESVVAKLAKENSYSMVLEKGDGRGVMYTVDSYDITKKVIDTYNNVYAAKKGTKKK